MRFWKAISLALLVAGCHATPPAATSAPTTARSTQPIASPPLARSADGLLINPSFPITIDSAKTDLEVLASLSKAKLDRPLVICGGFMDVGFGPWLMERTLRRYVEGEIICVHFATAGSFADTRRTVVRRVDEVLGKGAEQTTKEVDVIGQSMGGLIAVHAALDDPALEKRLKIRRLYTICSPLQGAKLATLTSCDVFDYQRDMRPGSALGKRLAATALDYELISYARLRDDKVGEGYSGLPGHPLWWVDTPAEEDAHDRADFDPRILLDVIRRLQGREKPITRLPAAPLPPAGIKKPGD